VWHDRLVWIGSERLRIDPERPVPLIVYPPPGISRALALEALERHGRSWRIACTSGSLNGLIAAARAGLGVMAHSRGLIPPGLVRVPDRVGLPELGEVDFVLRGAAERGPGAVLAQAILGGGERLHRAAG
jgi:DNA-binding transcriptional LysR family regulator